MMSPFLVMMFDSPRSQDHVGQILGTAFGIYLCIFLIITDAFIFTAWNMNNSHVPKVERMHGKLLLNLAAAMLFVMFLYLVSGPKEGVPLYVFAMVYVYL